VNPSTTDAGTKAMYRPALAIASPIRMIPASIPTASTPCAPCVWTIGTSTTVIAPVGPETWRLDPPKAAAIAPAITAVVSPAAAPRPEEIPNPSASGSATIATVRPAIRSRRG
jgi:hypothetical protein